LESGGWLLARFRLPAVLVALTVLYGTLGYLLLEGWSLTDALFMTVTTLATVGYGEVRPLDTSGKLFSISLIVLGIIALAATFDAVAGALLSGELQAALRRRRMRKRLDGLDGHYIVCAYRRVGGPRWPSCAPRVSRCWWWSPRWNWRGCWRSTASRTCPATRPRRTPCTRRASCVPAGCCARWTPMRPTCSSR
jgi:Ion channel